LTKHGYIYITANNDDGDLAFLIGQKLKKSFSSNKVVTQDELVSITEGSREGHFANSVDRISLMLLIINGKWAPGNRVAIEVAIAVKRNIPVIPVLVGNTKAPPYKNLPYEIGEFFRVEDPSIDREVFNTSIYYLKMRVESVLYGRPKVKHDRRTFSRLALIITLVIAVCGALLLLLPSDNRGREGRPLTLDFGRWESAGNKMNDSLEHLRQKIDSAIASAKRINVSDTAIDFLSKRLFVVKNQILDIREGNSAILGYSYPRRIKRKEIGHINVYVEIESSPQEVRQKIKMTIERQTADSAEREVYETFTENVIVYDSLDIELIDPQNLFSPGKVHTYNKQKINKTSGNKWEWTISTSTDKNEGQLILKVEARTPTHDLVPFDAKYINIKILIDNDSFLRRAWIYIIDNPGVILGALGTILVTILGYFWKRRFDSKKEEKEKVSETAPTNTSDVKNIENNAPQALSPSNPTKPEFHTGQIVQHKFNMEKLKVEEYLTEDLVRCSLISTGDTKDYLQKDLEKLA